MVDLKLESSWVRGNTGQRVISAGPGIVCFSRGKYLFFQHVAGSVDGSERPPIHYQSAGGRHIGQLAFCHARSLLAYSEVGVDPKVYVHGVEVQSGTGDAEGVGSTVVVSKPLAILSGAAKLELRSLQFSANGKRLLMLSGVPDFQLSVWDWQQQMCLCKKSCSNHPLEASFSPSSWQKICCRGSNSLGVFKVESCANTYSLASHDIDLPRVQGTKCPTIDSSSSVLAQLPMAHPRSMEPLLSRAGEFAPNALRQPAVEITAACWWRSGLYVASACGKLLKVVDAAGAMRVDREASRYEMFDPGKAPTMMLPGKDEIVIACKDEMLRSVKVGQDGRKFPVLTESSRPIPGGVASLDWTQGSTHVIISSAKGDILLCEPKDAGQSAMELKCSSSPVVAIQPLWPGNETFALCRSDGTLEAGGFKSGGRKAAISLQDDLAGAQVTAMAVCPSVQYIVVGDSTGTLTFLDADALLSGEKRILCVTRMHFTAIAKLWFDDYGSVLLVSSLDSKLCVCSPLPTDDFLVHTCVDLKSQLLDISCQPVPAGDKPTSLNLFLLLAAGKDDDCASKPTCKMASGSTVLSFNLPTGTQAMQGALNECIDKMHSLDVGKFGGRYFTLPEPCTALCAVQSTYDSASLVATSASRHCLLALQVPDTGETPTNPGDNAEAKYPEMTVRHVLKGPQLCGGSLFRSLRGDILVSVGTDGQVACGTLDDWDNHLSLMLHSHRTQGCQIACLSWDGKDIVSSGRDGVIACSLLSAASSGTRQLFSNATAHYRRVKQQLIDTRQEQAEKMASYTGLDSGFVRGAQTGLTWSEHRLNEVNLETEKQFAAERHALLADVSKLREKLMAFIAENEQKPELERLDRGEFNLDMEESKRLMTEGDNKAREVREELELKSIANEFLTELIRAECWDNMESPGKLLRAFHTELEVSNFALPKEDPSFRAEVEYLLRQRELEVTELKARNELEDSLRVQMSSPVDGEEGSDQADKADMAKKTDDGLLHSSLEGSIAHTLNGRHALAYGQMELSSRARVYFQLHIVMDSIRKMKQAFNKEFDALLLQKESEVARTQERNTRMAKIIHDLELHEDLFQPEMTTDEQPERLLTVEDGEIKAEKWISPEERVRLEELAQQEEARRLAEMGDRPRERALELMMQGRLEIDPEEELYKDIPKPEYIDVKMVELWTEEERKAAKDYQNAVANLEEERAKHKKALEAEFKKLQSSVAEAVAAFDEKAEKLHECKIQRQTAICQEEMKVSRLTAWLLTEDELCREEERLLEEMDSLRHGKTEITKVVSKAQADLAGAESDLDKLVVDDKVLERNFKSEFKEREGVYDLLNKAYRRRPRQVRRAVADGTEPPQPGVGRPSSPPSTERSVQEMADLDSMANCPEAVDSATWILVVAARRKKVESERAIRMMNHCVAEMTAFITERTKEENQAVNNLSGLSQRLSKLRKERERFYANLPLQLLLKQGQVEVDMSSFVTDYRDTELIDRKILDLFNDDIKTLGEAKVSTLLTGIEGKKGIYVLEWEHRKMRMQIEDLDRQVQVVNGLRVTKSLQQRFVADNPHGRHHLSIEKLEAATERTNDLHMHRVTRLRRVFDNIQQKTINRIQENDEMDEDIRRRFANCTDRQNMDATFAPEDKRATREASQRMSDLVERSQIVKRVKQQAEQITASRVELNRWRNKMFPALPTGPKFPALI